MEEKSRERRKVMAKLTFIGGIHPYDGKDLSKDKPIREVLPKGDLVYPLSQHIGAPANPIVKKGDRVLTGQKIAEASGDGLSSLHYKWRSRYPRYSLHTPHPQGAVSC